MTCQNCEYWKAQAAAEKRRAENNLRLAAERAGEIGELQQRVKELEADIATIDGEYFDQEKGSAHVRPTNV